MCGMENKRKIPYGVINWAEIVRECLFVDNTRYIRELEAIKTPVFLRPKRFGKSVVCSMLALYYLGLLTFQNRFRFNIPNLTIRNKLVRFGDQPVEGTVPG